MMRDVRADDCGGAGMTLAQAEIGRDVMIHRLNGPGCERLRDLGFCEEMCVRKLSGGRTLLCSLYGSRLAISRELADQVFVVPA